MNILHNTRLIIFVISLIVFTNFALVLIPITVYATDTGVCWLTEEACSRDSIDGVPYSVPSYIEDKEGWDTSSKIMCRYKPSLDRNDDSISLEYKCYDSVAEAILEYEYLTGQKVRPNIPEGFSRKTKECRSIHNSYQCDGYVLMGRNVVQVKANIPFARISNTPEMQDKGIAAAQKRLEIAKTAATRLSPVEKPSVADVEGKVYALDFLGLEQIIPYAKVELEIGGAIYVDYTNIDGKYSFDLSTEEKEGKLTLTLSGYRDDRNIFEVIDNSVSTDVVTIWRDINIEENTDFVVDVALSPEYKSTSKKTVIRGLVDHYYHTSQAVDFAEFILMTDVSVLSNGREVLPISVFAYSNEADNVDHSSHYDPEFGSIHLTTKDSDYYAPDSPFTIFHEFGHHIMHTQYSPTIWDADIARGTSFNHGGIMNDTTADSVGEGLATFIALLMAQEYEHVYPHAYEPSPVAFGRNWEINYKAWDMDVTIPREELAFMTLLYDLIDSHKDKGDDVQIEFSKVWDVIKDSKNQTVKDYYDAIIPLGDKAKIDALFIEHGFFWDKQEGDKELTEAGTYTSPDGKTCTVRGIEPGLDINKDGKLETHTEAWMDYSNWHQYPCQPTFDEGDEVGFTGSYQTTARKSFENLPNRFMEVDNGTYVLDYTFPNDPEYNYTLEYEITDNKLPVNFPPARYNATVSINDEIEISSDEYQQAIQDTFGQDSFRNEKKSNDGVPIAVWVTLAIVVIAIVIKRKKK